MPRCAALIAVLLACSLASCASTGAKEGGRGGGALSLMPFLAADTEVLHAKTDDGWNLALHHYPPKATEQAAVPVLLCHDMGSNASLWQTGPQGGLAGYLSAQGFDVWSMDMRGCGQSAKEGWLARGEARKAGMGPSARFQKENWNFDDSIHLDLPAVLRFLQEKTGRKQVHAVGIGMGAAIVAGFLQTREDDAIKNFVAIGLPMTYPRPCNNMVEYWNKQGDAQAPLSGLPFSLEDFYFHLPNMDGSAVEKIRMQAAEDVSPGQWEQFLLMIRSGEFLSSDRRGNYAKAMERIAIPTLLLAGPLDNVAGLPSVYETFYQIAATDKTLMVLQRSYGRLADYGHWDMICGRDAAQDTYTHIANWLKERS